MTTKAIPRDHLSRPLIIPPGGDKPKPYTRSSKFASTLDDSYGLDLWHQRLVALGLQRDPSLLGEVERYKNQPKELDGLCSVARALAGEKISSAWGTVIHWFTECIDNDIDWQELELPADVESAVRDYGEPIEVIYELAEDDLDAYEFEMQKHGITRIMSEQFCVCDEIQSAGTLDGVYEVEGRGDAVENELVIGDLKTGKIDMGEQKFAMQEAIYARSVLYEVTEDDDGNEVINHQDHRASLKRGLLIHLPMRQGRCDIYWIDLVKGWDDVLFGRDLRERRRKTKRLRDISLPDPVPVPPLPEDVKTVADLKAFAAQYSVPLSGATKKSDILAAIAGAEGEVFE